MSANSLAPKSLGSAKDKNQFSGFAKIGNQNVLTFIFLKYFE